VCVRLELAGCRHFEVRRTLPEEGTAKETILAELATM